MSNPPPSYQISLNDNNDSECDLTEMLEIKKKLNVEISELCKKHMSLHNNDNAWKKYYQCHVYCGHDKSIVHIITYDINGNRIAADTFKVIGQSNTSCDLLKLIKQLQNHIGENTRLIGGCNGELKNLEAATVYHSWSITLNFMSDKYFRILDSRRGIDLDLYIEIVFTGYCRSDQIIRRHHVYYSDVQW